MPQGSSDRCHNLPRTWSLWLVAPLSQFTSLSHVLRSSALPDSRALFLISSCQMRHELPLGHSGLSIESSDRTESYVNFSLPAEAPLPHCLAPISTRAFPDHGLDTLSLYILGHEFTCSGRPARSGRVVHLLPLSSQETTSLPRSSPQPSGGDLRTASQGNGGPSPLPLDA